MNNLDKQYIDICKDILQNGDKRMTRSGEVLSVFGRTIRHNLKDGFPLLTTKKVFYKGMIHELLWFISGSTNIKYLVDNNVNIWNQDAYRFFKEQMFIEFGDDLIPCSMEEFIERVKKENKTGIDGYKFGDLGPVYGKSWRRFGTSGKDQLAQVIAVLKTNPTDRERLLMISYDPDVVNECALPPCHVACQFWTRELSTVERMDIFDERDDTMNVLSDLKVRSIGETLDYQKVPKRELSCMFQMRSVDWMLGAPFNVSSYAILTHMIAQVCNMTVGEIIGNFADTHIYTNQIEGVREQITRKPFDTLPTLKLNPNIKDIDDFKFEDIEIENYESHPAIKFILSTGLE
jgi:thymidylate synthase